MATCPRCGGYLGDRHRCRGRWYRFGRALVAACVGSAAGVVIALVVSVVIPGYNGPLWSVPTLFVVGGLAGLAMWWMSSGRRPHA